MTIEKRDNMGYAIHPALIVLLIILGAGLVVTAIAGMVRVYFKDDSEGIKPISGEQFDYMKQVRERNLQGLYEEGRRHAYRARHPDSKR
ncbi:hypothetical protein CC78DRAFT_535407 [Lojkania enalia]|uniref:Uncharacterized protein n=1 Tax=Lojkania enalia TaxID=147567 RepID=A0A9P4K3A1_9PLEO|nr:hypothetical protein CC78DRAFT_535407 [Didymosphaeria enalia]